ncbi:MAG TPA: Smr/MutS family protein [Caulobacterales bacterium]|nr:Smr/MutS family protein [Caulobacterales bacterium]
MRKRQTTEEERALFADAFREARPHRASSKPAPATRPQPAAAAGRRSGGGLDGNTALRLRRGEIEPERRIDLHGMTEDAAHGALLAFLKGAQRGGARLVLVITGKGARQADPHAPFAMDFGVRGVLKTMVPRWLAEPAFESLIADHRTAHRRHGGAGALYVYLRKRK